MVFLCLNVKIGHWKVGKIEDSAAEYNEWENAAELKQIFLLQGYYFLQGKSLQPIGRLERKIIKTPRMDFIFTKDSVVNKMSAIFTSMWISFLVPWWLNARKSISAKTKRHSNERKERLKKMSVRSPRDSARWCKSNSRLGTLLTQWKSCKSNGWNHKE